jgi:AbrB family transcriptional regulator (stage V sporulation protein T)
MFNVKATGIIRKIDELGRIVIPKELRRTLRIREGDPLEIYTDRDGEVIFRKYSLLGGIGDFAAQICDAIYQTTGLATLVTDRDNVLAVAGASRREYGAQPVSEALERIMGKRGLYCRRERDEALPVVASGALSVSVAAPIMAQGDVLGCLVIGRAGESYAAGETEVTLAQTIAGFLGRHMEE